MEKAAVDKQALLKELEELSLNYWSDLLAYQREQLSPEQRRSAALSIRRMGETVRGCSPIQRATLLYKMVTSNIVYDYDTYHAKPRAGSRRAYDYYGGLTGKAVCAGIAELFVLALTAAGIDSTLVVGYGYDEKGGEELHAWVKLKIPNEIGDIWYNADPTWDLGSGFPKYFLRSDAWMEEHWHLALNQRYPQATADIETEILLRQQVAEIYQMKEVDNILCQLWKTSKLATP